MTHDAWVCRSSGALGRPFRPPRFAVAGAVAARFIAPRRREWRRYTASIASFRIASPSSASAWVNTSGGASRMS